MIPRAVMTLFVLLTASLGPVNVSAAAPPSRNVITVPSGDTSALYAAVFDGDRPRDEAEIVLEGTDTYVLDPALGPAEGRLVLGRGTVLRSSLELGSDERDIPTGQVVTAGAIIDTVKLESQTTLPLFEPAAVIMKEGSAVKRLTVTNSGDPTTALVAFDILRRGMVDNSVVERHFQGVRVRVSGAPGDRSEATITRNVLRVNAFAGIVAVPVDPLFGVDSATIRASIRKNLVRENGIGVFVPGAFRDADGGTSGTHITVTSVRNVYEQNGIGLLAQGAVASPVSAVEDSVTVLRSRFDMILDSGSVGLSVAGAARSPTTPPSEPATANDNRALVVMASTVFENNAFDVEAFGSASADENDTLGEGNRGDVRLANTNPNPRQLSRAESDCAFLRDDGSVGQIEPCPNHAKIVPPGG